MQTFTKTGTECAVAWEAAGLTWLAKAEQDGGVRVAQVLSAEGTQLEIERITETAPSKKTAREFGEQLAKTHLAGAKAYGAGPDGWSGNGLQGPANNQLKLPLGNYETWGQMWAEARLLPLVKKVKDFDTADRKLFDRLCNRLANGDFDGSYGKGSQPARVHGDLWSGNVLWSQDGAVLIDPAPYGGRPEDDLAALALFGAPHLNEIIAGYQQITQLDVGWQERVQLHQLHLLLLHAVLFGGGYVGETLAAAQRYV